MITITDLNGSRNFLLSQVIKKVVLYMALFIATIFISGAVYIKYLGLKIDNLRERKDDLISQNEALLEDIKSSKLEIEAIEGKISDLEQDFGLSAEEGDDILSRITHVQNSSAKEIQERAAQIVNQTFTQAQKEAIFRQIPNGRVMNKLNVTSKFGWRDHPIKSRRQFHLGVDLRAPLKTPVYAPADGIVQAKVTSSNGYGNLIEIRHNYGFTTRYAHLDSKMPLKVGDFVSKGDIIAYSGNSGDSTGPHLHYEVHFLKIPLNPMSFINWNEKKYNEIFEKEKEIPWQSLIKAIQITDKSAQ